MRDVMGKLAQYRKFLVAAAAALGVYAAVQDGGMTSDEWWAVVSAGLGALGVVTVRNADKAPQ